MTRLRLLGALVLAGLTVVACSSSGNSPGPDVSHASSISTPAESLTASFSPAPASTTESTPTSAAPTSSAPPTQPTVTPKSTCTNISVRVLPGGASPGQEIAAVQYTNAGTTSCVLVGYPTVTLLLHGQRIGSPSVPATPAVASRRQLAPGQVAESLVHDYTQTCQAPLSDSVRVTVPGTEQLYLRPGMQLRACLLRIDKLGAPE